MTDERETRETYEYLKAGACGLRMGWRRFKRAYRQTARDPERPRKPSPRELIDGLVALQHRANISAAMRAHPPLRRVRPSAGAWGAAGVLQ